jgi:hypothetical protein
MKLKLTKDELTVVLNALNSLQKVSFNTVLEKRLCKEILVEFVVKQLNRSLQLKKDYSIKLDTKTLLVLNCVLPQIYPTNDYDLSVMTRIIQEINQACLSI